MTDLPDPDTLYAALIARDPAWEGRAYVGVTSTGVFCRLTCPARKPKRANCVFVGSVAEAVRAGFRACKRCHPTGPEAQGDPVVAGLLTRLQTAPEPRRSEALLRAEGYAPSTVRRAIQRHFGMSFLEMARHARLRLGAAALPDGKVIEAQMDAGFSSAAAFRAAFGKWLGLAPGRFARDALLKADIIETALGAMVVVSSARAVHLLEFTERRALPGEVRRLHAYAKGSLGFGRLEPTTQIEAELAAFMAGRSARFETPLAPVGPPFAQKVWAALQQIPPGETRSYSGLAAEMGRPDATRAVARANGANPIAIAIPCHRVLGADGALTGYGGGLWRKQALIEIERGFARPKTEQKTGVEG